MVAPKPPSASTSAGPFPSWFRPNAPVRTKWLAFWLLLWDCAALTDALAFTFNPEGNLNTYHGEGTWCAVTLAVVRMFANCQLGLVSTVALLALTSDEKTLKNMFKLMMLITLGAFRGVYLGVMEGTIIPPWESWWASLLSLPPFIFLGYFAFLY